MSHSNPLLEPWSTPFGLPPFDRILPEHYAPAFEQAMTEHAAEITAIAENPAPPSFANTIEALERAGASLKRISAVFYNLVGSLGGEALELLDTELSPKLARHWVQIASIRFCSRASPRCLRRPMNWTWKRISFGCCGARISIWCGPAPPWDQRPR